MAMTKAIDNLRNQIDYLTSISRYWIEQGDWETANNYIDKTITLQNEYDETRKAHQDANPTLIIDNPTLICRH